LTYLIKGILSFGITVFLFVLIAGFLFGGSKEEGEISSSSKMDSTTGKKSQGIETLSPLLTLVCTNKKGGKYFVQHETDSRAKFIQEVSGKILYPVSFKTSDHSYSYDKAGRSMDFYSTYTNFWLDRVGGELNIYWKDSRPNRHVYSGGNSFNCKSISEASFAQAVAASQDKSEIKARQEEQKRQAVISRQKF
tara:strand:+ start:415 stop:993 length:579 start_codon:yes stop_codon:yes gene_type:complete